MWIKCNPGSNQGANGLMTFNLESVLGLIVLRFVCVLSGTFTKAQITDIKLKANGGKPIFDSTGTEADQRMIYRGHPATAGLLSLDFSERKSKTIVGQMLGALNTVRAGITSLTGEFTVAGATTPGMEIWAECIRVTDSPENLLSDQERAFYGASMSKVLKFVQNFPTTSETPLPLGAMAAAGARAKRVHLYGNIASVTVKRNGIAIHDRVATALNNFDLIEAGKTLIGSCYTLDFLKENNQSDALDASRDRLEFLVTPGATGNVTVVQELYDLLGNN